MGFGSVSEKQSDLPPEVLAWLFSDTEIDAETGVTKNEG
jgi:hypothetical protein